MKKMVLKLFIVGLLSILSTGSLWSLGEGKADAYYGGTYYVGEHDLCITPYSTYEISYYGSCWNGYSANVKKYYSEYTRKYEFYVTFPNYPIYNQPFQGKYKVYGESHYGYSTDVVDIYMGNPDLNNPGSNFEIIRIQDSYTEDLYVECKEIARRIFMELLTS